MPERHADKNPGNHTGSCGSDSGDHACASPSPITGGLPNSPLHSSSKEPLISVVIPNYNGAGYLEKCLRSLLCQTYSKMEIVVVDNASQDPSVDIVRKIAPQAILLRQRQNLGFAGGANAGIRASRGDWVAVLNNDAEAAPHWLSECVHAIQNNMDVAFLACRILDLGNHNRLYSAGDCFLRAGIGYRRGQEQQDRVEYQQECPIFSASGCAALYRKALFEQAGGFDERFFAYLEDVDLGLRFQAAGYRGIFVPRAEVYHHGGATSGGEFSALAVRLRTRNALLLLIKSMPGYILLHCWPMILFAQLSWFLRVVLHRRLGSYLKGLGGALVLGPAMIQARAHLHQYRKNSILELWNEIRKSEDLAREDFARHPDESGSLFLRLYFGLFRGVQNNKRRVVRK